MENPWINSKYHPASINEILLGGITARVMVMQWKPGSFSTAIKIAHKRAGQLKLRIENETADLRMIQSIGDVLFFMNSENKLLSDFLIRLIVLDYLEEPKVKVGWRSSSL